MSLKKDKRRAHSSLRRSENEIMRERFVPPHISKQIQLINQIETNHSQHGTHVVLGPTPGQQRQQKLGTCDDCIEQNFVFRIQFVVSFHHWCVLEIRITHRMLIAC